MRRGLVLAILLYSGTAGADSTRAVTLFEEGRELATQGKDAEACDRFLQSLELEPAAGTELNLALCLQRQGYLRRAWGYYDHVARNAKRDGDVLRAKYARERADAIAPQLGTVVIDLAEPDVQLTINERLIAGDGAARRELVDPGDINVEVTAPGRKKFTKTLTVMKGQTATLSVPVLAVNPMAVASTSGGTRRRRSWVRGAAVLGVLAAADLGFAAVATNTVLYREDEYEENGCSLVLGTPGTVGEQCRRRLASLHEWQGRALWSTLLGVTLAGSATLVYIVAPTERVTITPTASASQVSVTLGVRF